MEELEGLADVGDRRRTVEEKHVELANRRASLAEIRSAHDRLDQDPKRGPWPPGNYQRPES